jgi:RNA polymerase sigma-70 factor, ECF subfamily
MADWSRSDDVELLAAARREGEAFGVFYDRHVSAVLAFFRRRTNGAELTMDLTAETFARALEGCRAGNAIGQPSPASWLFTIARNLLIDAYRSHGAGPVAFRSH